MLQLWSSLRPEIGLLRCEAGKIEGLAALAPCINAPIMQWRPDQSPVATEGRPSEAEA